MKRWIPLALTIVTLTSLTVFGSAETILTPIAKTNAQANSNLNVQAKTSSHTAPLVTRTVAGHVLTSKAMPAVRIEFDKAFKYAGAQSFVLYDVANAEQHFFVNAGKDRRVKRLYWIQFEGYLPDNTYTYDYDSPKIVTINGFNFFADLYARSLKGDTGRPDSDGNRARAYLQSKGFHVGTEVISQRLVHLVDKTKRNELMIIYLEDLSDAGFTAADINEGGRAHGEWSNISQAVLARAQKFMKIGEQ
jgi:hypothetical protein